MSTSNPVAPAAVAGGVPEIKNSKDVANKGQGSADVKIKGQYILVSPAGEGAGEAFDDDEKEQRGYRREAPGGGGNGSDVKIDPRDLKDAREGTTRENRDLTQTKRGKGGRSSFAKEVCPVCVMYVMYVMRPTNALQVLVQHIP